jgi:hypothetical protein
MFASAARGAVRLKLFPLLRSQLFAKSEKHPGVSFLEFRTSLRDSVNLRDYFALIRFVCLNKGLQCKLSLFERAM